jgi:hypothetical protein
MTDREIQAAIASKLGWTELVTEQFGDGTDGTYFELLVGRKPGGLHARDIVPDYLTGDGMLLVIDQMVSKGWDLDMRSTEDGYEVEIWREYGEEGTAAGDKILPRAVCLAALAAIGDEQSCQ